MSHPMDPQTEATTLPRREFLKKAAMVGGTALAFTQLGNVLAEALPPMEQKPSPSPSNAAAPAVMPSGSGLIEAKNFDTLLTTVEGISQNQLKQHIGLYQGYVKKTNEIQAAIAASNPDPSKVNTTYDPFRELHVEQSYALNGVVLHELYFGNLGGKRQAPSENLKDQFSKAFGSWNAYTTHLKALGKAMRGWSMTAYNLRDGKIHNYGMDLHNQLVPVSVVPLLVLDVYEHAYMIDFGTNRGAYLDAFLSNINWEPVERRLALAQKHGPAIQELI